MLDKSDLDNQLPNCPWNEEDAIPCQTCGLEMCEDDQILFCPNCEGEEATYYVHTRTENDSGDVLLWGYTVDAHNAKHAEALIQRSNRFDDLPNTRLVKCEAHHEVDFDCMFFSWKEAFSKIGFMNGKYTEFTEHLCWQLRELNFTVFRMLDHDHCIHEIRDGDRVIWNWDNQPDILENNLDPEHFFEDKYLGPMLDGLAPKGAYLIP